MGPDMSHLRWKHEAKVSEPILIAAFEGWNDAGEAASGALRWLTKQWNAKEFANVDPEEFYDFTEIRPTIRMEGDHTDRLKWPSNTFFAARPANQDVILLDGIEPQLKWRTFCETLIQLAQSCGVTEVYTLQSSLADVPHTRPSKVMSFTTDPTLASVMDATEQPTYEGPTGITSVFREQCDGAGINVASLWVSVPHYVGHVRSPKASLSLIRALTSYLRIPVNTESLREASDNYEMQISELVDGDEDVATYVRELEQSADAEAVNANDLGAAAEQFLRDKW